MLSFRARLHVALCLCAPLVFSACATLPNGRSWGEDATYRPGWSRVKGSAVHAARDPWVWGPLLGAGLIQIDGWDREVSDWAREETPFFGSQQNAEDWSDDLKSASAIAFHASLLATPSGSEPAEWMLNKARGYLVEGSAIWLTSRTTQALKDATDRERPNGLAQESFPSGHSSASAVHTQLASRNLRSIELSPGVRRGLDFGLRALTLGTSWARVEAGWHFPSDTLFSIALGNFMASFFHDTFMGLDTEPSVDLRVVAAPGGAELRWQVRF
jgi:membrane-associated phospholipid phosphatase